MENEEGLSESDIKYLNEPFDKSDLQEIEKFNKSGSSFFNT